MVPATNSAPAPTVAPTPAPAVTPPPLFARPPPLPPPSSHLLVSVSLPCLYPFPQLLTCLFVLIPTRTVAPIVRSFTPIVYACSFHAFIWARLGYGGAPCMLVYVYIEYTVSKYMIIKQLTFKA